MQKFVLDKTQLSLLVFDNRYLVDPKRKFLSRCIDGRYDKTVIPAKAGYNPPLGEIHLNRFPLKGTIARLRGNDNLFQDFLPALSFPGADAGELALVLATARSYGFTVDKEKVYKSLIETIGGEKNFQLHTDSHGPSTSPSASSGQRLRTTRNILVGCGHIKQIGLTPEDYNLTKEDLDFVKEKSGEAIKKGAVETVLHGDHGEGAVVYIKGNYGIYPQYSLRTEDTEANVQIFIYHQTLVDERHRVLVSTLLRHKAVKLPEGCDEEYLYNALSETAENHTLETAKRLALGLPIFQVIFDEGGMFNIKEMGTV